MPREPVYLCNENVVYVCGECGEEFTDKYATGIRTGAPAECPRCGEEDNIIVKDKHDGPEYHAAT